MAPVLCLVGLLSFEWHPVGKSKLIPPDVNVDRPCALLCASVHLRCILSICMLIPSVSSTDSLTIWKWSLFKTKTQILVVFDKKSLNVSINVALATFMSRWICLLPQYLPLGANLFRYCFSITCSPTSSVFRRVYALSLCCLCLFYGHFIWCIWCPLSCCCSGL